MGVDIDIVAVDAGLVIAHFYCRAAALGLRVGRGNVVRVTGGAVAAQLAVNFGSARFGMLHFFKYHNRRR